MPWEGMCGCGRSACFETASEKAGSRIRDSRGWGQMADSLSAGTARCPHYFSLFFLLIINAPLQAAWLTDALLETTSPILCAGGCPCVIPFLLTGEWEFLLLLLLLGLVLLGGQCSYWWNQDQVPESPLTHVDAGKAPGRGCKVWFLDLKHQHQCETFRNALCGAPSQAYKNRYFSGGAQQSVLTTLSRDSDALRFQSHLPRAGFLYISIVDSLGCSFFAAGGSSVYCRIYSNISGLSPFEDRSSQHTPSAWFLQSKMFPQTYTYIFPVICISIF